MNEQKILLKKNLTKLVNEKKYKIGLSWRGNPSHERDKIRSIPVQFLSKIFKEFEKCKFFVIQKKLDPMEINFLSNFKNVINCDDYLDDFSETAMLVSKMNQIISVDTVLAHLSGSIGIPTNLLLPKIPDWRWGLSGDSTDWYPSVLIFRQSSIDCWENVLEKLSSNLSKSF